MPYIGNFPAESYSQVSYQDLTGGSGTSFTLDYPVGSAGEIEVFINNVRQEPTVAYTVSGTALTMTGSVSATDDFYVVFQGKAEKSGTIPEKQSNGDYNFDSSTLFIDSTNNRVGVGTSSPLAKLDVVSSASVTQARVRNQSTGATAILFQNSDTGTADGDGLYLGRSAGINYLWTYENEPLVFATDNLERLRIDSSGNVDLTPGGGNIKMANGAGIDFSATSNITGTSSELLDDYEEGTHEPVITASTTSPTYTIVSNRTVYIKVGRLVSVNVDVNLNITATGSGHIYISLPFATDGSNNYHSVSGARNNTAFSLYDYELGAYAYLSRLELMRATGTNGVEATLTNAQVRTGSNLRICFQYIYTTS